MLLSNLVVRTIRSTWILKCSDNFQKCFNIKFNLNRITCSQAYSCVGRKTITPYVYTDAYEYI